MSASPHPTPKSSAPVLAVTDACGTGTEAGEDRARRRMERAGIRLTSTSARVAEPVPDGNTPQGIPLVQAMAAMSPMLPVEGAEP